MRTISRGIIATSALLAFAASACREERSVRERSASNEQMARVMGAGDAPRPPVVGGPTQLTTDQFVMDAVSGGKTEVELSRIAVQKSGDGALKQFAETIPRYSDSSIGNAEVDLMLIALYRLGVYGKAHFPGMGELDGIAEEIDENLSEA